MKLLRPLGVFHPPALASKEGEEGLAPVQGHAVYPKTAGMVISSAHEMRRYAPFTPRCPGWC